MLPKMGGDGVGFFACVILLLCAVNDVNSYSKYGRGCQDIGCLPSEECVITQDSCSYSQREGKDCGSYPTCKRKIGASSSATRPVNPSGLPHGLQPVNPYNPSFVFGQQPFYPAPGGTGGPPGSNGGGLAPYYGSSGFQNPNMYNKPPPQYQNQNPNQNTYNRQTQSHHRYSSAARVGGSNGDVVSVGAVVTFGCIAIVLNMVLQQWVSFRHST